MSLTAIFEEVGGAATEKFWRVDKDDEMSKSEAEEPSEVVEG